MERRMSYEKPSRINAVTVLLVLCLAAAAYAALQYAPPYYRRWKAAGVLSELVNKVYPRRTATGQMETDLFDELSKEGVKTLQGMGIPGDFQFKFRKDAATIAGTLDYRETVKHWFVNKTSVLDFHLEHEISATSSL